METVYRHFGKPYHNEIGIISLTSWTQRINTVQYTLYTLFKHCPAFHIVLCLSLDEFPRQEHDLPRDLYNFCKWNMLEIIWCPGNVKALKKILYTMSEYPQTPVICADDDCLYTCNYAQMLYDVYIKNPDHICTINAPIGYTNGTATLYYPDCFGKNPIHYLDEFNITPYMCADDDFYYVLRIKHNCKIAYATQQSIWITHNETSPLHNIYSTTEYRKLLEQARTADINNL